MTATELEKATRRLAKAFRGMDIEFGALAEAEQEPVEVVAVVTLGGIFHGGSGPELGDIDIEPSMSALEGIQLAAVHSDEDVHLDLMTVTQHERIVAAMAGQIDWQNITD